MIITSASGHHPCKRILDFFLKLVYVCIPCSIQDGITVIQSGRDNSTGDSLGSFKVEG